MRTVLLAVTNERLQADLSHHLRAAGITTATIGPADIPDALATSSPGALALSVSAADPDAARHVSRLTARFKDVPIVLVVRDSTEAFAIGALRAGVADYHREPASAAQIAHALTARLAAPPASDPSAARPRLVGHAETMREVRAAIDRVARTDTSVLVTGETGTGKEMVASSIHDASARGHRPLISINCAAIPDSLIESELFGYEKGAFTGAAAAADGKLQQADGGTAFFDEIGEMTPLGQAKILRALETREVVRLGGRRRIALNMRVIAATNRDLERAIEQGEFRKDLYYRLDVVRIHLPPLRLHPEDIPDICGHYIAHFNQQFGRKVTGLSEDALSPLVQYGWPGNVRELKNLLEAVFVNLAGDHIGLADLPAHFRARLSADLHVPDEERQRLLSALLSTRWNVSRAAEHLRWSRMTMYRKMAKYQLHKSRDRRDTA